VRVLVDSSAWVDYFNDYPSALTEEVDRLLGSEHELCTIGVVVLEVAQGLRYERRRHPVLSLFRKLTLLEVHTIDPYLRAAELYRELRARGVTIRSSIDCLVVAAAEAHGCRLLFRDRDLDRIVASGLTSVLRWHGSGAGFIAEGP
jgi:predicted nucleic acid-binding protein